MNYYVFNHHDFWKWPMGNVESALDADVIFMWADWPFKDQMDVFKALGKKIITYEHGFGSLADYYLNNRQPCSEGYLALGKMSKALLAKAKVPRNKILVTGSPVFDGIEKKDHGFGKKAIYVALHWMEDRTEYNNNRFSELREAYPDFEWTVKLNDKAGFSIEDCKTWKNNTNEDIIKDIKNNIHNYDMVFTPRYSTFDTIATLAGLPVYVIDENESYRIDGDPKRVELDYTFLKIGDRLPRQKQRDMSLVVSPKTMPIEKILKWCENMI